MPERLKGVLRMAAEKAGWGKPLPAGHAMGSRAGATTGATPPRWSRWPGRRQRCPDRADRVRGRLRAGHESDRRPRPARGRHHPGAIGGDQRGDHHRRRRGGAGELRPLSDPAHERGAASHRDLVRGDRRASDRAGGAVGAAAGAGAGQRHREGHRAGDRGRCRSTSSDRSDRVGWVGCKTGGEIPARFSFYLQLAAAQTRTVSQTQ